ncbi:efflux RND transporter periplasmic adaptor subunit [Aggregicoccus sp. 17bor-14]|uniref:efflux RND transporter periplasmic adaptor subunit n=1 Tax=Myxococcaceae TaxID=31 RepID=UPI00129C9B72|nr:MULTISPECIES: efflux RND transporter periplasmic adaptor subunit [Myxococcaceae]MBF5040936.1 efflux RND transporter periplasmic adaptor subunit [Simulacricoccus sp. 17bor-14]MRI86724.1 efflux RND transporter periplasmic adaptor subunit [Aggregicoccus sp. 17bor-14]
MRPVKAVLWVALSLGAVGALGACNKGQEEGAGPAAGKGKGGGGPGGGRGAMQFPVEVAPVQAQDVEYAIHAVGAVEAFERVQITARVAGALDRVRFREGEDVKKGTVLAEIEPSRYALAVTSAKAAVERARAEQADAEAGFARREAVNQKSPGLLPAEEIESFRTRARSAAAQVSAAKAALDQAELNLRDAYVRAPMDGTLQSRNVQTGQYVQPGTVLATLLQRDPLLLRFTVPEGEAARLKPGLTARFTTRDAADTFSAKLTYVAASADPNSRMVAVTGEVTGEGARQLRPGAFATVTVPVGSASNAPVIPQTAVRPSERGFLAYVVEGGKAHERVVELGLRTTGGLVEVRQGLKVGEQLVVRGAEALREGAPVRISAAPKTPVRGEPGTEPEAQGAGGRDAGGGAAR